MELAHLTPILPSLAAEPASIIYIVSGAVGLIFARRRASGKPYVDSSVAMLFCRKATREKMSQLKLV